MLLWLLAACLDHTQPPGGDEATFVAMQSDFASYLSWEATTVSTQDTGHVEGERVVYLNARPPEGAAEFPVGTIFVKTIAWSGGTDLHAMVKRGGGFNPDGAAGWEWFELVESDGVPIILWRGEAAPEPGSYLCETDLGDTAETVTGDCNTCHGFYSSNDYVQSVALGG